MEHLYEERVDDDREEAAGLEAAAAGGNNETYLVPPAATEPVTYLVPPQEGERSRLEGPSERDEQDTLAEGAAGEEAVEDGDGEAEAAPGGTGGGGDKEPPAPAAGGPEGDDSGPEEDDEEDALLQDVYRDALLNGVTLADALKQRWKGDSEPEAAEDVEEIIQEAVEDGKELLSADPGAGGQGGEQVPPGDELAQGVEEPGGERHEDDQEEGADELESAEAARESAGLGDEAEGGEVVDEVEETAVEPTESEVGEEAESEEASAPEAAEDDQGAAARAAELEAQLRDIYDTPTSSAAERLALFEEADREFIHRAQRISGAEGATDIRAAIQQSEFIGQVFDVVVGLNESPLPSGGKISEEYYLGPNVIRQARQWFDRPEVQERLEIIMADVLDRTEPDPTLPPLTVPDMIERVRGVLIDAQAKSVASRLFAEAAVLAEQGDTQTSINLMRKGIEAQYVAPEELDDWLEKLKTDPTTLHRPHYTQLEDNSGMPGFAEGLLGELFGSDEEDRPPKQDEEL